MFIDLTLKARARRNAALQYVAKRKSGLVAYSDFRLAASRRTVTPLKGFVSSRTRPSLTVAA